MLGFLLFNETLRFTTPVARSLQRHIRMVLCNKKKEGKKCTVVSYRAPESPDSLFCFVVFIESCDHPRFVTLRLFIIYFLEFCHFAIFMTSHFSNTDPFQHGMSPPFQFSMANSWNGDPLTFCSRFPAKLREASEVWSQAFWTMNIPLDIRISNSHIQYLFSHNWTIKSRNKGLVLTALQVYSTFLYSSLLRWCILFLIFLYKQNPTLDQPWCLWVIWFFLFVCIC